MKLYCFPIAPNPTRVRLLIAEKSAAGADVPVEEVFVNLAEGEQKSPEFLAINPVGALPVLVLDDGTILTESLPIMELLEELYPEPCLVGRDPVERAQVRRAERALDLGVLLSIGRIVHATRSPLGRPPQPEVAAHFAAVLEPNLERLDAQLADGRPFVCGERVTIADCTLAAGLQFGRFRDVEVPARYEHVHRWDGAYRERPAAKAVLVT